MDMALKILMIPGNIPFPPDDGGKICIYGFIDSLRKRHSISIVFKCNSSDDLYRIQKLKLEWPETSIYYTPFESKEKKISILSFFKKNIRKILYFFKRKPAIDPYQIGLNVFRTTPFYPQGKEYINLIINILKKNKFDIIQTEQIEDINLIHIFPTDSKKIFVQIENRGEIINDYGVINQISATHLEYIVKNTEFLEDQYMKLYDAIFTLNDLDRIKIQNRLPTVKVYNSPFAILEKDIKVVTQDKLKLENLIFVGSENHFPNLDGLEWFLQTSRKNLNLPELKNIYVTGNWTKSTQRKLRALDKRLVFLGFVEDLSPYFRNSVSIVPIRIGGGGIRTKILLAMAQYSPVISTSIAAVGITGSHKDHFWIANTIEEFLLGVEYLFQHPEFTMGMIESANKLIHTHYSQSHVSDLRNSLYLDIYSSQ